MERYDEEELLYLMRCGCEYAQDDLCQIYYRRIMTWIKPFENNDRYGIDKDDLIQMGMINFFNALLLFRDDQNTSLYTYVKNAVMKRTYGFISTRKDKKLYQDFSVISLDDFVGDEDGSRYDEIIEDPKIQYHPQKIFQVRETSSNYLLDIESRASLIEKNVLQYRLNGFDEKEISQALNIPLKSVYNAVYRIHKKLNH